LELNTNYKRLTKGHKRIFGPEKDDKVAGQFTLLHDKEHRGFTLHLLLLGHLQCDWHVAVVRRREMNAEFW
jgi:hypothetical protein